MGLTHLVFLSRPDRGHLYPTLRLAEELGARGHRVTFATGDPYVDEAAGPGVTLLRFGRYERSLRTMPAFTARLDADPPAAVVCDPRTVGAATEFGREWGASVVVAHTNLAEDTTGWPAEHSFGGDYVFVSPGGRGAVHDAWRPADHRPVLLASLGTVDGASYGLLARAFGDTGWQVVIGEPRGAVLEHASAFLTDGRLDAVSSALRLGVPMVLAPRTAEQRQHARQVANLGLGRVVRLAELSADELRRTVERLAADEVTSAAAREIRTLVRAAGTPARAADEIEARLPTRQAQAA